MTKELPKTYEPRKYEDSIYKNWEKSGFFNPDNLNLPDDAPSYTIILPPPNITDKLHLGHSSMLAIEDLLIRFHRMRGFKTLWVPGTDHAAIATQNVVEKKLLKEEGKSRHDLGRDKFLEHVWKFLRETQSTILKQTRKMGASLDWSREAFTLDDERKKAVTKMFIDMYEAGVIYRGERIINWCPRCHSTLADDEVEYKERKATLYTFKYSSDFPISIATTRPETKLGDTAVAVNPKDKRYKEYIGKEFTVDFVGNQLTLKIIADREVDKDFGTGALGVTPAHSMADWKMAENNDLKIIKVIGEDGKINKSFSEYAGLYVKQAREAIAKKLKKAGLIEKEEEIDNNLSVCYRCNTPIEPLPSKQWFISVDKKLKRLGGKSLKEKAILAAAKDKIKFIPEIFTKRYMDWMENLHDWCISRQIWFGHRIPVWYKKETRPTGDKVNLLLVRHGQTDWNKKGIMMGRKDIGLNKQGEEDAVNTRDKLKDEKINLIISSPAKRTSRTAEVINGTRNIKHITDERLLERNYGKFEGKKTVDVLAEFPDIKTFEKDGLQYWIEVPGAETYDEVRIRVKEFIDDIKCKYAGKNILIVSHGDTLDMFYAELENIENRDAYGRWSKNCRYENYALGGEEEIYVGETAPKGEGWTQDPDSLDTWFSSGMWTFSTLGWPENYKDGKKTGDLAQFHPTQVLETGYEILTLWVSRMIMMSLFALGEIPFENVYLHGMVLDEKGKKMSKSKGNGIDPIDVIAKYGTDAVRLSLLIGSTPGNDVRIFDEKIEGFRNMVNKLWNISRYILQTTDYKQQATKIDFNSLTLADKYILSQLADSTEQVTEDLKNYKFSNAGECLREFTWNNLADWYLEATKFQKGSETQKVLLYVSRNLLKLWHPFIPFVTEVLWKEFNTSDLIIEKWPEYNEKEAVKFMPEAGNFQLLQDIIISIRNARAENGVDNSRKIKTIILPGIHEAVIEYNKDLIIGMRTGITEIQIESEDKGIKDAIKVVSGEVIIYLIGAIDPEKEKKRIEKEIENKKKLIANTEKKLANKDFTEKAPEAVVNKQKENLNAWQEEFDKLKEQLKNL